MTDVRLWVLCLARLDEYLQADYAFFLPVLELGPIVQTPRFLEYKLFELGNDTLDSAADGALVALVCLLKELTACSMESAFPGRVATVPVRDVADGADILDTHLRE